MAHWKRYADWAKHRPLTLRLADRLGRSRGRLGLLNHVNPPKPVKRKPDLTGWDSQDLAAVWLGHATVLLRVGGMTILTDPVLSNRVGVGLGLFTGGPGGIVAPALSVRELPQIDLILISHAHFDHLDRPTLARLPKQTPVVTADQTRDLIRDLGFRRVTEMRWGESLDFGGVTLTARQVRHWGARTFHDHHRGFNAYLIESNAAPKRRVLYGGDTAYQDYFRDVGRGVDLAVLGIGGYDPYLASPRHARTGVGDGRPPQGRLPPANAPQHLPPQPRARPRADASACWPSPAPTPAGWSSARWEGSGGWGGEEGERGRGGDKEKRRQGEEETRREANMLPCLPVSLSPCLPVSLSPCLPVSLSPCLPVSLSPCLPVSLSPCLLVSLSPPPPAPHPIPMTPTRLRRRTRLFSTKVVRSFYFAFAGLAYLFRTQRNGASTPSSGRSPAGWGCGSASAGSSGRSLFSRSRWCSFWKASTRPSRRPSTWRRRKCIRWRKRQKTWRPGWC